MDMKRLLPNVNDLILLTDGKAPSHKRSAWLGVSQALLNYPRLLGEGLISFTVTFLIVAVVVTFLFFMEVLFMPFMGLFSGIVIGLGGRVSTKEDIEGTGRAFVPFNALKGARVMRLKKRITRIKEFKND